VEKVVDLRKKWQILEKRGGFEANSHVAIFGERVADFPQIRQYFNNSEVNNFFKKHF
jgi:hypothetical protein